MEPRAISVFFPSCRQLAMQDPHPATNPTPKARNNAKLEFMKLLPSGLSTRLRRRARGQKVDVPKRKITSAE